MEVPGLLTLAPSSFTYSGNGNGNMQVRVSRDTQAGRFNGTIDNLSVSEVVPEPSSFALMSLAITGLGLIRCRRNRE